MKRFSLLLLGMAVVPGAAPPAIAQEEADPYVRESFWKLDFADLEEWNAIYAEQIAPILADLQSEGVITGWSASQHFMGGDYTWRFALIVPDWASIDAGVSALTSRMQASGVPNLNGMIRAHEDQIWRLTDLVQREGATDAYLHMAAFDVMPSELETWNAFYADVWRPALQEAMDAGLVNGWAVEEHAHGGSMNWQILYLMPSWDAIDDTWALMFERFEADPARWESVLSAFTSHRDDIWETITVDTGTN